MGGISPLWGQQFMGGETPTLPTLNLSPTPQAPKHSGGMFAAGGAGRAIAGMIGDFLLQRAGMQPIYQPTMLEQRRHQREIDDYNRKRADDNADWQTHYDYKLHNPEPTDDQYTRALIASGVLPGTPEYAKHMAARTNVLENPMVMTPYGPMPYSAVNPVGPKVGDIVDDPRKQGGQTGAPSGGFPY